MATTKKSPKAKTKTSKTVKTVKSVKSSKVTITSRQALSLPRLQLISGIAFLIAAILAGILMSSASYATTISYLTMDKLNGGAIVPAYRHFFDFEMRWLVVGLLLLSAIGPLLHATRMKQTYANAVKSKVMPWRFIEQGVLQAIMLSTVALLYGYQDIVALKLFALLAIAINLLSWYAEKEFLQNKIAAMRSFVFSIIAAALATLFIGMSGLFTYMYGQVRASWFVYSAFAVVLVTLALNVATQFKYLKQYKDGNVYELVEKKYVLIALVSKLAFTAVLIIGLAK